VREDFFEDWLPNMAYVLGFICADGSIQLNDGNRKHRLHVASTDFQVVEDIRKALDVENNLKQMKRSGRWNSPRYKPLYYFSVGSNRMVEGLVSLGLSPRKSYDLKPIDVPDEYFWDFLRGYTDGDGSIKVSERGNCRKLVVSWGSGSWMFIEDLRQKLNGVLDLNSSLSKDNRKNFLQLSYFGSSAMKILDRVYENGGISLERKRSRYLEFKERLAGS